jgi:hypothetical protein
MFDAAGIVERSSKQIFVQISFFEKLHTNEYIQYIATNPIYLLPCVLIRHNTYSTYVASLYGSREITIRKTDEKHKKETQQAAGRNIGVNMVVHVPSFSFKRGMKNSSFDNKPIKSYDTIHFLNQSQTL